MPADHARAGSLSRAEKEHLRKVLCVLRGEGPEDARASRVLGKALKRGPRPPVSEDPGSS